MFWSAKKYNLEKVILLILDGFGLGPPGPGNPITAQNMPFLASLVGAYQVKSLAASGLVVGLEWGTYGNSEVGHAALGTGRITVQSLARINMEIKNGKFFQNEAWRVVLKHAQKNNSRVHIIGCVSPGGIHSHENHLIGLLDFFAEKNFSRVYVHMITDGEDSGPTESLQSLKRIEKSLDATGAKIASVCGRNFAMDRVKNWPLTRRAWQVIVEGQNQKKESPETYLTESHHKGIYDANIEPAAFGGIKIEDGDGIIFFNYRNDRIEQLAAAFVLPDFSGFTRERVPKDLIVVTMTNYDDSFKVKVAYPPIFIPETLGEVLSKKDWKQLRLAESEKEAHVTNFFNGERLAAYNKEERIIVQSRGDLDYIARPEMAAREITENILANLTETYKLLVVNFANSDMVAHTGNIPATAKALQTMDQCLEKIIKSIDLKKNALLITADHGNAEELIDPATHGPDTQHSTANVPLILVNENFKTKSGKTLENLYREKIGGSLIDVAPTILRLLDIKKPRAMTGSPLVK